MQLIHKVLNIIRITQILCPVSYLSITSLVSKLRLQLYSKELSIRKCESFFFSELTIDLDVFVTNVGIKVVKMSILIIDFIQFIVFSAIKVTTIITSMIFELKNTKSWTFRCKNIFPNFELSNVRCCSSSSVTYTLVFTVVFIIKMISAQHWAIMAKIGKN